MKRWLLALLGVPLAMLVGCGFFSTPAGHVVECSAASMAEALAQFCPPPVTALCTHVATAAFEQACNYAAAHGATQNEATQAGVSAAKSQLARLRQMGISMGAADGGAP